MHQKKHLSFNGLVRNLSENMNEISDPRQSGKVQYSAHDCAMSAFAMMFFQDPSMLEFQTRLQEAQNFNNLQTMFHVENIPKATQLRDVVDILPTHDIENVFTDFFRPLQRGKHLESFRFLEKKFLLTIDGVQFFSSDSINCTNCLTKDLKSGTSIYSHQAVCGAIVREANRGDRAGAA